MWSNFNVWNSRLLICTPTRHTSQVSLNKFEKGKSLSISI